MAANLNTRNCNQCEALHINGTLCHEQGCSDAWRDSTAECNWCGSEFKPETQGQEFCEDSCQYDYHGIADPDAEEFDADLDPESLNYALTDIAGGLTL